MRWTPGSVLIIPHGFPERLDASRAVTAATTLGSWRFDRDAAGLAVPGIDGGERCIEWCFDRVEDGKFADQEYLDDWPQVHEDVVVLERPGVGMAPWNFIEVSDRRRRQPTNRRRRVLSSSTTSMRSASLGGPVFDDGLTGYGVMDRAVRGYLYGGYVRDLAVAGRRDSAVSSRVAHSSGRGARWVGCPGVREARGGPTSARSCRRSSPGLRSRRRRAWLLALRVGAEHAVDRGSDSECLAVCRRTTAWLTRGDRLRRSLSLDDRSGQRRGIARVRHEPVRRIDELECRVVLRPDDDDGTPRAAASITTSPYPSAATGSTRQSARRRAASIRSSGTKPGTSTTSSRPCSAT